MHSSFDDLVPHMKRAGFTATTLAASITAMFGWELGENLTASIALAGLLALCTYIVGYSLVAAHAAYKRNMTGISAAATALFLVAVTCEFIAHVGFNASNRDATVQNASLQTITFEDTRKTIADAEAKLDRLRSERAQLEPMAGVANIKPWRDPASAKAAVATAEAHRFYRMTKGCTETRGPQTRAHCETLANARAEVERWELIAKKAIEIGAAEQDLNDIRKSAALQHTGHAAGGSQNLVLASLFTANTKPDATATYWSGIGISALLAIFAIAAGALCNVVAYAFEPTSKPIRRAMTQVRADIEDVMDTISTKAADTASNVHATVITAKDDLARELAEIIARMGQELKAA